MLTSLSSHVPESALSLGVLLSFGCSVNPVYRSLTLPSQRCARGRGDAGCACSSSGFMSTHSPTLLHRDQVLPQLVLVSTAVAKSTYCTPTVTPTSVHGCASR